MPVLDNDYGGISESLFIRYLRKVARRPRVARRGTECSLEDVVNYCTTPDPFDVICVDEPVLFLARDFLPARGIIPLNWTTPHRDLKRYRYDAYSVATAIHAAHEFPYCRDQENLRNVACRAHRVAKYIRKVEGLLGEWEQVMIQIQKAKSLEVAYRELHPVLNDIFYRMQNTVPMRSYGRENFNVFKGDLTIPY